VIAVVPVTPRGVNFKELVRPERVEMGVRDRGISDWIAAGEESKSEELIAMEKRRGLRWLVEGRRGV